MRGRVIIQFAVNQTAQPCFGTRSRESPNRKVIVKGFTFRMQWIQFEIGRFVDWNDEAGMTESKTEPGPPVPPCRSTNMSKNQSVRAKDSHVINSKIRFRTINTAHAGRPREIMAGKSRD
jgi:hypothetical protein